jgi:hypothetical protein
VRKRRRKMGEMVMKLQAEGKENNTVREYCEDKCYSQGLQRDIKIKTNKRKEE